MSITLLDQIAKGTGGTSYKTLKYVFDNIDTPQFDYDHNNLQIEWSKYGENTKCPDFKDLRSTIQKIEESKEQSIFCYFLDGSRKVYKVDDMAYNGEIYPVMAGQVAVGCCERVDGRMQPLYYRKTPMFNRDIVISLPRRAKKSDRRSDDAAFAKLLNQINRNERIKRFGAYVSKIISYSISVGEGEKLENKGIATIQDYMVAKEVLMVASLAEHHLLDKDHYLIKDGTLEYKNTNILDKHDLQYYRRNYQYVIGVSKQFNPALITDINNKNPAAKIAKMKPFSRTPVMIYKNRYSGDVHFAVWFVRIRDSQNLYNPFDGVLKIEKMLFNEREINEGLDSEYVDMISAHIINERSPVCYGADKRWANHIYPVYVTESYLKSQYLSEAMFLNLF